MLQFINYPTRFDNRDAAAALKGSGISCPPLEDYADQIWDYWERHLDPDSFIDHTLRGQVAGKVVLVNRRLFRIGLATVHKTGRGRAITIICGRDEEKLAEAKKEVNGRGFDVFTYSVDVSDMTDCDRLVQLLIANHGGVDVLINNAGRSIRRGIGVEATTAFHDFERTMQLNYFGGAAVDDGTAAQNGREEERACDQYLFDRRIDEMLHGFRPMLHQRRRWMRGPVAPLGVCRCGREVHDNKTCRWCETPMIAPTKLYQNVPTLTPDEAADLIAEAIVYKPVRIATRLGIFGEVIHALLPRVAQVIMNTTYRMFADFRCAKGLKEGEKITAADEHRADCSSAVYSVGSISNRGEKNHKDTKDTRKIKDLCSLWFSIL
jgi:hypothetical protein